MTRFSFVLFLSIEWINIVICVVYSFPEEGWWGWCDICTFSGLKNYNILSSWQYFHIMLRNFRRRMFVLWGLKPPFLVILERNTIQIIRGMKSTLTSWPPGRNQVCWSSMVISVHPVQKLIRLTQWHISILMTTQVRRVDLVALRSEALGQRFDSRQGHGCSWILTSCK